jgi:hypothetical protein
MTGSCRPRRWSSGHSRVVALAAGSGVAGGIEGVASAVGAGFDLTNTVVMVLPIGLPRDLEQRTLVATSIARRNLQASLPLISAAASDGLRRAPPHFCNAFVLSGALTAVCRGCYSYSGLNCQSVSQTSGSREVYAGAIPNNRQFQLVQPDGLDWRKSLREWSVSGLVSRP